MKGTVNSNFAFALLATDLLPFMPCHRERSTVGCVFQNDMPPSLAHIDTAKPTKTFCNLSPTRSMSSAFWGTSLLDESVSISRHHCSPGFRNAQSILDIPEYTQDAFFVQPVYAMQFLFLVLPALPILPRSTTLLSIRWAINKRSSRTVIFFASMFLTCWSASIA